MFALLKGRSLRCAREKCSFDSCDVLSRAREFILSITGLSYTARRASKSRDYVLSVWANCPSYQIPEGHHSMSAGKLLQDAFAQLEHCTGFALRTYAPSALFSSLLPESENTHDLYLENLHVRCMADAYSHLSYGISFWFTCCGKEFDPDFVIPSPCLPRNSIAEAVPPNAVASTRLSAEALDAVHSTIMPCTLSRTHASYVARTSQAPAADLSRALYGTSQGVCGACKVKEYLKGQHPDEGAFAFACQALGLQAEAARKAGLNLMVRSRPPMIGLSRVHFATVTNICSQTEFYRGLTGSRDDNLVVAYEVCHLKDSSDRSPKLIGVWIPIREEIVGEHGWKVKSDGPWACQNTGCRDG